MKKTSDGTISNRIVVVGVIALLSGLGWIVVKLFDINSTVSVTANRVDRIVDALPELRTKIAREELEKKIDLAIVTTNPLEISPGKWVRSIQFYDYKHGRVRQFFLPTQGPGDENSAYSVSGLANRIAIEKISFDEYSAAANEIGRPKPYPNWLDASAGYVIVQHRLNYLLKIQSLLGKPAKELPLEGDTLKWMQFVDELERQQKDLIGGDFTPPPHP